MKEGMFNDTPVSKNKNKTTAFECQTIFIHTIKEVGCSSVIKHLLMVW